MFLTVEWAKRRLPAVFLLLSLLLPWWTMVNLYYRSTCPLYPLPDREGTYYFHPFESFRSSFLWADTLNFKILYFDEPSFISVFCELSLLNIPFLCFVSALILLSALCGLSNETRTRTLGGLLGIGGVVFYFIWRPSFHPWPSPRNFYFGIGEYTMGVSCPKNVGAVWSLSVGFYLAIIGSLMLLALSIRTPTEAPKEPILSIIEGLRESIFLSIAWIKRRLPAVFLLLSLLLPWWTMIHIQEWPSAHGIYYLLLSFPWNSEVDLTIWRLHLELGFAAKFSDIASFCFVSALIFVGGLCGLSRKRKTRSLGGLLAILGIVSFFMLVFHENRRLSFLLSFVENPYIGTAEHTSWAPFKEDTYVWFLSVGFYLALAGSLMLLLPLIRTLIERLRKRL